MDSILNYKEELTRAMTMLSQDERVIFVGQSVKYPGQIMTPTLTNVPVGRRLELPIMEDAQLGLCIGLSLEGFIPVSLFSRFDFLIVASNQLINHLDKIERMSPFSPKVIIRTIVGSTKPLYPGLQHTGDYTEALKLILRSIKVVKLGRSDEVVAAYKQALDSEGSTLIIEIGDLYGA